MFNRNHSSPGNYILTFAGGMLGWKCDIDLDRAGLFFLNWFIFIIVAAPPQAWLWEKVRALSVGSWV